MADLGKLPRYQNGDIYTYISHLRRFVHFSQQDAADYFHVDRSRISRYENPSEIDEIPFGYLACLVKLVVEYEKNDPAVQEMLLFEANTAFLEHYKHSPFKDWAMLCDKATEYLAQQRSDYIDKRIIKNFPNKLSRVEQIELLESRLGPASYLELIGMDKEMRELLDLLTRQGPPWIIAVVGLGGIGKTSLAHAVAQQVIHDQLYDNVGWLRLRQKNNNFEEWKLSAPQAVSDTETLFDQLLLQLAPDIYQTAGASNLNIFNLLRIRLKQIPHLVVIDNLETPENLRDLISKLQLLTNPSKFLLTSRVNLFEEPTVYPFSLQGLSKAHAVTLMHREGALHNIRRIRVADERLLEKIYEIVGGNPLALRLVVSQAHTRPFDTILRELSEAKGGKNQDFFDFIYQDAWQHLSQRARIVLLNMLLATYQAGSLAYLAALAKVRPEAIRPVLDQLVALNLVNVNDAATESELRYTTHSLTRAYLRRIIHSSTNPSYWAEMRLSTANSVRYVQGVIQATEGILSLEDQEQALQTLWYGLQWWDLWSIARMLLLDLAPKMEQAGLRETWVPYLIKGIRSSKHLRDRTAEAELRFHLGTLRQRRGDYPFAHQEFSLSADIFARVNQRFNQAKAINRKAYVARLQRNFVLAEALANQALGLLKEHEPERAYSFLVLGTVNLDLRNFEVAASLFQQALNIWTSENNQRMMAWCLTNLGAALRPLKRYAEAVKAYQEAIRFFEEAQDPVHLAVAWMNLGNVYLTQDQSQKALNWYEKANNVFQQVQEQLRLAQIHMNMGMAHFHLGQWERAETFFVLCIEQYEILGNAERVANGLDALGLTFSCQQRYKEAIDTFQDALNKLASLGQSVGHERLWDEIEEHLQEAIQKRLLAGDSKS